MQKLFFVKFVIAAVLALFSSLTLAAEASFYSEETPNISVTKSQAQFTIKLKSNPTTGYSWFLRDYNSKLIAPLNHHFEVPQSKMIGAPGIEVWTFRVKPDAFVVPHQMRIRFMYARPWDKSDNATQAVFRITTIQK